MRWLGLLALSGTIVTFTVIGSAVEGAEPAWQQVHPRQPTGGANAVTDVAFADGRWVVVSRGGAVLISPDGRSWHETILAGPGSGWQTTNGGRWLVAAGGGRVVLVNPAGFTAVSSTGQSWQWSALPELSWADDVAWNGARFVAIGQPWADFYTPPPKIASSADGLQWTTRLEPAWDEFWKYFPFTVAAHGSRFVAGPWFASAGDMPATLLISDDGDSWSMDAVDWVPRLLTATGDGFAAVGAMGDAGGPERLAVSPAGLDWSDTGIELPNNVTGLACHRRQCVTVGRRGSLTAIELDAATAEPVASPTEVELTAVACGPYGCVAGGQSGMVLVAPGPAGPWTITHREGPWPALEGVAVNRGHWVAVGVPLRPSPNILTSPDGVSWSAASVADATVALHAVAALGTGFVAVGDGGTVLSSADGVSWTPRPAATAATLRALAALGDRAVAVGGDDGGMILTGGLAGDWLEIGPACLPPLHDVIRVEDELIAVGDAGTVLDSPDGLSWQPRATDLTADLRSLATNGHRWLAVAEEGRWDYLYMLGSTDGEHWLELDWQTAPGAERVVWNGRAFYALESDGEAISPNGVDWAWDQRILGARAVAGDGVNSVLVGDEGTILRKRDFLAPSDPAPTRLVVPVVADLDVGGSPAWRSVLRLRQLEGSGGHPVRTSLMLPVGANDVVVRDVALRSGGTQLRNLLPDTFGVASRVLPVAVLSDAVVVGDVEIAHLDGDTSYLQRVPAFDLAAVESERLLLLTLPATPCRTNLVLVDPSAEPMIARVEILGAAGVVERRLDFRLNAWQTRVVSDLLEGVATAVGAPVVVRISAPAADRAPIAVLSLIDDASGDVLTVAPVTAAASALAVPSVAHAHGVAGSIWTSDLVLHNPGAEWALFQLELRLTDEPFDVFTSPQLALAPGASVTYHDVVASVLGTAGSGWLRIVPAAGRLAAWSRTWDRTAPSPLGQPVPAVVEAVVPASTWLSLEWLRVATAATPGWRSSLGLLSVDGIATVSGSVLCRPGPGFYSYRTTLSPRMTRTYSLTLPPDCSLDDQPKLLRVNVNVNGGARVIAWASSVHALSGDALFVLADPGPATE